MVLLAAAAALVAAAILRWSSATDASSSAAPARDAPAAGRESGAAPVEAASGAPPIDEVAAAARPGRSVILVGLDGGDWALLDRYVERGRMPNLRRLVEEGRSGVLASEHPPLSPLLWTTMLTGVGPLEHGVLDFARFHPETGRREPITSAERRAPALWNMATWAGRSVAVLGMWATYPAEPVRGVVVSDRLFSFLYREAQPPAGVVYPETAATRARAVVDEAEAAVDHERLAGYLPWLDEEEYERLRPSADPYAHPVTALRRILVETAVYHRLAVEELTRERPDLAIVYIQGTDTIGHTFARYVPPRLAGVSAEEVERYGSVPERYFQEIDELLGDYARIAKELGAVLLLVSDHGFRWSEGRPAELSSHRGETAAKWHRPEGIFLIWGDGIAAEPAGDAHPLEGELRQVTATVLALLGLPRGEAVAGPPLAGIAGGDDRSLDYRRFFQPSRWRDASAAGETRARATRADDTAVGTADGAADGAADGNGRGADKDAGPDPAAEAELAKLRALGYLGGADERPKSPPSTSNDRGLAPTAPHEAAPAATWTAGAYNNRGLILRREGRTADAIEAFERAIELDPELASAQWNLSDLLHAEDRDLERSDGLLAAAARNGLPEGSRYLVGRAIGYQRAGRVERAIALLELGTRAVPAAPDVWLFLGRYEMGRGDCARALERFEHAVELAPRRHQAHGASAMARLCVGDERGAAADLERSLAIEPEQPELRAYLERLGG